MLHFPKFIVSLLFQLFIIGSICSQIAPPAKVYTVGEFDRYIKESLIFDHPFEMKMELDKSVALAKKGVFMLNKEIDDFRMDNYGKHGAFPITKTNMGTGKKNAWYLSIPDLKPNKNYLFLVPYSLSKNAINSILSLSLELRLAYSNKKLDKKDILTEVKLNRRLKKKYENIISRSKVYTMGNSIDSTLLDEHGYSLIGFKKYVDLYDIELHEYFEKITSEYCDLNNLFCADIPQFINNIKTADFDTINELSKKFIPAAKSEGSKEIIEIISKIRDIKEKGLTKKVLIGIVPLDFVLPIPDSENHEHDFSKRESNLKNTVASLSSLLKFYRTHKEGLLSAQNLSSIDIALTNILKAQNSIIDNYKKAENIIKSKTQQLFRLKVIEGSTLPSKHKDYIKNFVKPDFGAMYFIGKEDQLVPSPLVEKNLKAYLGLIIQPFASNDDIPVSLQPWHKSLFIQLATPLSSIAVDDVRGDFFGKGNPMVGIGIEFNQSFHFSFGSILYNRIDRNNLIKNPKIASGFYFSIGYHPDLNSIFSPISALIF